MEERYQRHSLIDWFDQNKLAQANIIVVGAGAVGNEVLKNMALLGVGSLFIIDFDRIEEHNLTRSVLFTENDIGGFKADIAANACKRINPNIHVLSSVGDYWDCLKLEVLAKADCVICCVDNYEARVGLNQFCLLTGTDFYNTAIDSRYATVELFPFRTNPDCACFECTLPASAYDSIQKRYSCGWLKKVAIDEKKIPTTTITSSVAGSVASSIVLHRISNHNQALDRAIRYMQDTISLNVTISEHNKNDMCRSCLSIPTSCMITKARRECGSTVSMPLNISIDDEIILSEPIVEKTVCAICGDEQVFFESSRKLNDSIAFCINCGQASRKISFIERFKINEMAKIFSGQKINCKFMSLNSNGQTAIIELED